jgi:hypothetical protein
MMGFDVLWTGRVDLHLLRFSKKISIKPLSAYLLDCNFWNRCICESNEFHQSAFEMILSMCGYSAPLDLEIAHQLDLIQSHIT